jgi:hypothetical protein
MGVGCRWGTGALAMIDLNFTMIGLNHPMIDLNHPWEWAADGEPVR